MDWFVGMNSNRIEVPTPIILKHKLPRVSEIRQVWAAAFGFSPRTIVVDRKMNLLFLESANIFSLINEVLGFITYHKVFYRTT